MVNIKDQLDILLLNQNMLSSFNEAIRLNAMFLPKEYWTNIFMKNMKISKIILLEYNI